MLLEEAPVTVLHDYADVPGVVSCKGVCGGFLGSGVWGLGFSCNLQQQTPNWFGFWVFFVKCLVILTGVQGDKFQGTATGVQPMDICKHALGLHS